MAKNNLNAEKALIFRITHRDNLAWILSNGLHCASSDIRDPNFIQIGNPDLIQKRPSRIVDIPPGGPLNDYVPFYFTPHSPMMFNIKTGYNGITKRNNTEIVIAVSSLRTLRERNVGFVFSDRHAYLKATLFSSNLDDLSRIDWELLQQRDFKRDPNDPEKVERYQAEALVHKHAPIDALLGLVCYDDATRAAIAAQAAEMGINLRVEAYPGWYF
jgi:hypothetical protein